MKKFALLLLSSIVLFACGPETKKDVEVVVATKNLSVAEGKTGVIAVSITPVELSSTVSVTFESSDETIASVTSSGLVYGYTEGKCTIDVLVDGERSEDRVVNVEVISSFAELENVVYRKLKLFDMATLQNEKVDSVAVVGGDTLLADSVVLMKYFMFDNDLMYVNGDGSIGGEGGLVPEFNITMWYGYKSDDARKTHYFIKSAFFRISNGDSAYQYVPDKGKDFLIPRIQYANAGENLFDKEAAVQFWTAAVKDEDTPKQTFYPEYSSYPRYFLVFSDETDGSTTLGSWPCFGYMKDGGFVAYDGESLLDMDVPEYDFTVALPSGNFGWGGIETSIVKDEETGENKILFEQDDNGNVVFNYKDIHYVKGAESAEVKGNVAPRYEVGSDVQSLRRELNASRSFFHPVVLQQEGLKSLLRK